MKRASKADMGNMDWQVRAYGYNGATRPTASDVNVLLAQMPSVKFSESQRQGLLESADYAYSMRLRHNVK